MPTSETSSSDTTPSSTASSISSISTSATSLPASSHENIKDLSFKNQLDAMMHKYEDRLDNLDKRSADYNQEKEQFTWVAAYFDVMIRILYINDVLTDTDTKIKTTLLRDTDYLNGPKVKALLKDDAIDHIESSVTHVITNYRNFATNLSLVTIGDHQRKLLNSITNIDRFLTDVEVDIVGKKLHEAQRILDAKDNIINIFENTWNKDYEVQLNLFFKLFNRIKNACVSIDRMHLAQRTSDFHKRQIYLTIGQLQKLRMPIDKSYEKATKAFDKVFEVLKCFTATLYSVVVD